MWMLLLGLGGIGIAAAASQGGRVPQRLGKLKRWRPGKRLGKHMGEGKGSSDDNDASTPAASQWSIFSAEPGDTGGPIYVLDAAPGPVEVTVQVLRGRVSGHVRFPLKTGEKNYGWQSAPPGGRGVLGATVRVLNPLLAKLAPAADAAASAYGVPPGAVTAVVTAVTAILGAIPGKIERGRVEIWAKWREGRYGKADERARVKRFVAAYRDMDGALAATVSDTVATYQLTGEARGEAVQLAVASQETTAGYTASLPRAELRPKQGTATSELWVTMPVAAAQPSGELRLWARAEYSA